LKTKNKKEAIIKPLKNKRNENNAGADGYPVYPASEDIYNKYVEEENINPEDVTKLKILDQMNTEEHANEKGFDEDKSGDDLDVPGAELDDKQEDIGSEDEENNYYSLGGDDHSDLNENRGLKTNTKK
jgi:hypothetical protein